MPGSIAGQINPRKPKNEEAGTCHSRRTHLEMPSGLRWFAANSCHPPWRKADAVDFGARRAPGVECDTRQKWYARSRFSHIMISFRLLMRLFFPVRTISCFKRKLHKQWIFGFMHLVCPLLHMTGYRRLEVQH